MADKDFEQKFIDRAQSIFLKAKAELETIFLADAVDEYDDKKLVAKHRRRRWRESWDDIMYDLTEALKPFSYDQSIKLLLGKIDSYYQIEIRDGIRTIDDLINELPNFQSKAIQYQTKSEEDKNKNIDYIESFSEKDCKEYLIKKYSFPILRDLMHNQIDNLDLLAKKESKMASIELKGSNTYQSLSTGNDSLNPFNSNSQYSFQFRHTIDKKKLIFILDEINKEYDEWFIGSSHKYFLEILLASDFRSFKSLKLGIEKTQFIYIIERLSIFFNNLTPDAIETSRLFITKGLNGVPINANNYKQGKLQRNPKNKESVDRIIKRAQNL